MLSAIHNFLNGMSPTASVIISIAFMLFFGFAMTRLTKLLRLPNVTAYIITGILLGPYCLSLVPASVIEGMDFLSDIALSLIAFSTGEFFRLSVLKKNGIRVLVITLFEACVASIAIFVLAFFILKLQFAFSIVLAALAAATASASTMMTIKQTGARGDFVNTLLQVVAIDNLVALLAYSVAISLAVAYNSGEPILAEDILLPLLANLAVLILGGVFGFFMKALLTKKRSTDNRLIVSLALLFAFCGICTILDISPLLGCMSMGTVYINLTNDEKLFKQLNYFSPPLLLLFFVRSSLNFRLDALFSAVGSIGNAPLIVVGLLYFAVRIAAKYAGAFFGCLCAGKPAKVRNYMGLALIPQAGVAIGLAAMGARTLGGEMGIALETIILASSILYELVGPACAKLSLYLSGSYSDTLEDLVTVENVDETGKKKTEVALLIERIQKIQEHIPPAVTSHKENEDAFTEAAEEQYTHIHTKYPPRRFRK
ncbi:MAG: cation:proton antiporter [Ruminococcaceae bacterium]|nr:cation:proton antiporter [Oscillospiraceae bacterium]